MDTPDQRIDAHPTLQTFSFPPLATTDWIETFIPLIQYTATQPGLDPNDPMITTSTIGLLTTDESGLYIAVPTGATTFSTVKYYHTWIPVSYTQMFAPTATVGAIVTLGSVQSGAVGMPGEAGSAQKNSGQALSLGQAYAAYILAVLMAFVAGAVLMNIM